MKVLEVQKMSRLCDSLLGNLLLTFINIARSSYDRNTSYLEKKKKDKMLTRRSYRFHLP